MEFYLSNNSIQLTKKNRIKRTWYKVVGALSATVALSTAYVLSLPAITMSESYYCGLETHQHENVCYDYGTKLDCCDAIAHQHDDDCYDDGELICGLADYFLHTHSEICYDKNHRLVCVLPEKEEHQHTEACYIGEWVYDCGMNENEIHQHVEECFYQVDTLICEIEEHDEQTHVDSCYVKEKKIQCALSEEEPHQHNENCGILSAPVLACALQEVLCGVHTEECYDADGKLICGEWMAEEHTHTESCFDEQEIEEPVLICELEEHIHVVDCTSDKSADIENAEIWRMTIPDSQMFTGNRTEDLVAVAQSQIGYHESTRNFEVDEAGERKGYTRYGQWYGASYQDWDAMFVSFCLYYAGVAEEVFPYESDGALWIEELTSMELYHLAEEYQPVAGDVIFFEREDNIRVGIISDISEELTVIEGDSENYVRSNTYSLTEGDNGILGYGSLIIQSEEVLAEEPEESEVAQEPEVSEDPEVVEDPETEEPEVPENPETEEPEVPENPETEEPEVSENPEGEEPKEPETEEPEVPEEPENPEPEEPEVTEDPEGEEPKEPETEEPEVPENPETEEPEVSENPETEEPEVSENPETEEPEVPENPETEGPEVSEDPETEEPEVAENPETEEPEVAENPETEEPEVAEDPEGEEPKNPETEEPETEEVYDGILLCADYGEIHVVLKAPKDAFPVSAKNLELIVSEPGAAVKENLRQSIGEEQTYFAVDIKILCDGEEIQPIANVEVVFEMENSPFAIADAVEVYHVADEQIDDRLHMQEIVSERDVDGNVVMETNHFSTYVVTTADPEPYGIVAYAAELPNTWEEALTDRSSYIGVESEGYTDSPYTKTKQFKGTNITSLTSTGGTVYVGGDNSLRYSFYAETFWDGKKPVRVTTKESGKQNELKKTIYSDWILEDAVTPNGALKIDNVELTSALPQKFELYGRGNKIVIGENVDTDDLMKESPPYIYGGSRSNDSTTMGYPTNVVVTSGRWGLVMGGGGADANDGTQVTIRDNAEVGIIYGGGIDEGDVRAQNNDGKPSYNTTGNATNVYIEGGSVGEVFGGNQTTSRGIKVTGNINIDVSGGRVATIHAGNDHRGIEGGDELAGSTVRGGAVVNIYNTGSVTNLIGDYMHYDATYGDTLITYKNGTSTYGRHIMKLAELNVHSNNEFGIMDYWDIIRISNLDTNAAPNSVNVSSRQELLNFGSITNNVGSEYIGRMEVTNGGRFYLKGNAIINYMNEVSTTKDGEAQFDLDHGWMGESSEERRAWSTLAIEGSIIKPSTAATNIFTLSNPCDNGQAGLRIKGNVEGFSVLEACGTPMYSTGDTYYYYVVADSSDNGGKAFKEPEGAPYVVCYRYLDDGRIGWYLRERPVLTMENKLVRVGTEGALTLAEDGTYTSYPKQYVILHVDMKGFAYEWSSNPNKNRVDFSWTVLEGAESAYEVVPDGNSGISIQTLADIQNNLRTTANPTGIFANVVYGATGTDEGSTEVTQKVTSFDVIIDTEKAVKPRYYDLTANYHYTRGEDSYDDLRLGQTADAARCTYDFAKTGEELGTDGYTDSIMTTYEYKGGTPPKGADDALLRVYLPEGVTASTLTVNEPDKQFSFEGTDTLASLVSSSQVVQQYASEDSAVYNKHFAVTLEESGGTEVDLSNGAVLKNLSGKKSYHCSVYSHEKVDYEDITQEDNLGLQLQLQLNSLTKSGNQVGNSDPSALNDGELRIQIRKVGSEIEKTTTITVKKIVIGEDGEEVGSDSSDFEFRLTYQKTDSGGVVTSYEELFRLSHGKHKTIMVPFGTAITVQEINHDGYYVQIKNSSDQMEYNDTIVVTTPGQDDLEAEPLTITFYNSIGAEMPSTGDVGTRNYTLWGILMILGAVLLSWKHRRGRREI